MQLRSLQPAIILFAACLLFATSVQGRQGYKRIVSLNGTITEIICALGFEKQLAGVDVTSTYPPLYNSCLK